MSHDYLTVTIFQRLEYVLFISYVNIKNKVVYLKPI